jgi:hypothetical protein
VSVGDSLSGDRGGGSVDESLYISSVHEEPKAMSVTADPVRCTTM